jgi:hypothetical protein
LYDENDEILASSGELLHDTSNDDDLFTSRDYYTFPQELPGKGSYWIQYEVTTINGLKVKSGRYKIAQKISIDPELEATLYAYLNYENGYIDLKLKNTSIENGIKKASTGSFVLARASDDTDYSVWKEIKRFKINNQITDLNLWRDFTIE